MSQALWAGGEQVKLISKLKKNATRIRSDTRSGGTGGPAFPGRCYLSPWVKVRAGESKHPLPAPPAHTGASWRLPRCWHSNEKVNIEPKILGMAGVGLHGEPRRGNSFRGPAWLHHGLLEGVGGGTPRLMGKEQTEEGMGKRGGSSSH